MKEEYSSKVLALYQAVGELIEEGADINALKVSDITVRAGIGKGTAYEYFDNKEEIISSAIFYQINMICSQVKQKIVQLDDFSKIIRYVLDCMDQEIKKRDCFIKFIHIISDNGLISRSLHQKIDDRNTSVCMPEDLIQTIIAAGLKGGVIKAVFPLEYMCMTVAAKLMVYAMYLTDAGDKKRIPVKQMHDLICSSLLKEFN